MAGSRPTLTWAGRGRSVLRDPQSGERLVSAFSRPGEWVLAFLARSGTTAAVAARLGRRFVLAAPRLAAQGVSFPSRHRFA